MGLGAIVVVIGIVLTLVLTRTGRKGEKDD
jgi:hypothetical protein